MIEIIKSADCGNSPKNAFVENFTTKLFTGEKSHVIASIADDSSWEIVGLALIQGKTDIIKAMPKYDYSHARQLHVLHSITHGRTGMTEIRVTKANGARLAICTIFHFRSAKATVLANLKSFIVPLND